MASSGLRGCAQLGPGGHRGAWNLSHEVPRPWAHPGRLAREEEDCGGQALSPEISRASYPSGTGRWGSDAPGRQAAVSTCWGPRKTETSLLRARAGPLQLFLLRAQEPRVSPHLGFGASDPLKITLTKVSLGNLYDWSCPSVLQTRQLSASCEKGFRETRSNPSLTLSRSSLEQSSRRPGVEGGRSPHLRARWHPRPLPLPAGCCPPGHQQPEGALRSPLSPQSSIWGDPPSIWGVARGTFHGLLM